MNKGIIYYTDNKIEHTQFFKESQKTILRSGLPIVSCSLKPMDFGYNIVLKDRQRSYPTMCEQILTALQNSDADYVFFCEHDVLYHPSHFDFEPPDPTIFYYNINNWRWRFPTDVAIHYSGLTSLSQLCCERQLAIQHYQYRIQLITELGLDKIRSREPRWARRFGYEPATKKVRRGGVTDDEHQKWMSAFPNIDIRHGRTFSQPKTTLESFKHPPTDWEEKSIHELEGWNIKEIFNLWS